MAIDLNGVDFGGVVYFGIVEYNGEKLALTGCKTEGNGTVTAGGNNQWGFAKIPVKGTEQGYVQITGWGNGNPEQKAAAKAAKKAAKTAVRTTDSNVPKTVLVKR